MPDFELSVRAERELVEIFRYGIERFGLRQAEAYYLDVHALFDLLVANPRMGRFAPSVGRGVRRHEHGSHVILYEEAAFGVRILAVVHKSSVHGLTI